MKLILKKRLLMQSLALLLAAMVFSIGWIYLDYAFLSRQRSFDFDIYVEPIQDGVYQGESVNSTVIVFSNTQDYKPVEIYVSNCPLYSVCYVSVSNAMPTFTTDLIVSTSDLTPAGTYPVNVIGAGSRSKRSATFYLDVKERVCECSDWVNNGCGGMCGDDMYLARTCNPRKCDTEFRCAYNSSCYKDFSIESTPRFLRASDQKAQYTISLTSVNNFSGIVYLSSEGCPGGSVCSYYTNNVFVPEGKTVTTYLNVRTALGGSIGYFNLTTTGSFNNTAHSTISEILID
jgi:hypothetical protein